MAYAHAVPEWVRPSALAVADLQWLAHRRYVLSKHESERDEAEGIATAITWLWGAIRFGPATSRPEHPITRDVAMAEMWAAMAVCDGGGTPEYWLRGDCELRGLRYYPPDFGRLSLDHGWGMYTCLSWATGSPDAWERGRSAPMELPTRRVDGTIGPHDARARELVGLIEDTRRRDASARS
jgi:hypothetical protein